MIKFYSLDCPVCNVLKNIMDTKKIPYEYINNKEEVIKIGTENGIDTVPFAFIDNKLYTTNELREYLNKEEEK